MDGSILALIIIVLVIFLSVIGGLITKAFSNGKKEVIENQGLSTYKNKKLFKILALVTSVIFLIVSAVVGKTLFYDKKVSAENDSHAIVGVWKLNKDKTNKEYGDFYFDSYVFSDYFIFYEDGICRSDGVSKTYNDEEDFVDFLPYDEDHWEICPWYEATHAYYFGEYNKNYIEGHCSCKYTLFENTLILEDYYGPDRDCYRNVYYDRINYEDLILGDWVLTDEGSGAFNKSAIGKISFYSDGTCSVGGLRGNEAGLWSIVDDKLKVIGATGGMFWNYHGFLCTYELYPNVLLVYDDDGSLLYKYEKQ